MAITFGGKQDGKSKTKAVVSRLGKTTGASKGSKPAPKAKVKPILKKGTIGVTIKKKF